MRLIDADALEKFLADAEVEATKRRKYILAGALNTIQGNIRNFSTAEPGVPDTNVGDMISRQALCNWLNEMEVHGRKEDAHGYHNTCAYVSQMPSAEPEPSQVARDIATIIENEQDMRVMLDAQPEPKKGKWIDHSEDGFVECPFCHSATNCDGNKDELHYCFSCGADMRGE